MNTAPDSVFGFDDEPSQTHSAPGWMVTFADLLSLLLAFFALVFAASSVDPADWRRVVAPISTSFAGGVVEPQDSAAIARPSQPTRDPAYVRALFAQLVATSAALSGARLDHRDHALILTLPDFPDEPSRVAALTDLGRVVGGIDNQVALVAHGATQPIAGVTAVEYWRQPLGTAQSLADLLSARSGGRTIEPQAVADLGMLAARPRVDLVVHDVTGVHDRIGEADHAAR